MATVFKNYRKETVFVSSTSGFTFRIGPGEQKEASDAVAEDCLRAGLVPVENVEALDKGEADAAKAEAEAKAKAEAEAAESANADALLEAAEKAAAAKRSAAAAKRSAAAKKAAATRKAKAEKA